MAARHPDWFFPYQYGNPSNPKADGSTFGNGNPVLKDVKVRQALDHAIDRDTIIERVKGGYAKPATC